MWGMGGSTFMAFSSRTLSGPAPAAVSGLVVTCIAQGKRGVLSSGYSAWVWSWGRCHAAQRATRAPPGSGSGATGPMGVLRGCDVKRRCSWAYMRRHLPRSCLEGYIRKARAERRPRRVEGQYRGAGYSILTVTAWLTFLPGGIIFVVRAQDGIED